MSGFLHRVFRTLNTTVVTGLAVVCLLGLGPKNSFANEQALLGGRPFAPPSQTIAMPKSWTDQPIAHKTPLPVDLAIALDQQLYPALGPIIERYAKENSLRIAVQDGTCGISAGLLAEKTVDMGGFCCPPGATDRLPGLTYHTVGIGALALITHADNPVDNLSMDDARQLFGGEMLDWADLPMSGIKKSPDSEVRAIGRLHCKVRPGHWRLILDAKDNFSWGLQEVSAITDMVGLVARTPGALGYETLWHIDQQHRELDLRTRTVKVNRVDPHDARALARGDYPLYRVFNITTWEESADAKGQARDLADYLIAHAGDIASEFAIVPALDLRRNRWRFDGNELIGEPPR